MFSTYLLKPVFSLFVFAMLCSLFGHAQPTSSRGWYEREDIQHVDIGWIKVLQFKEPAKPFAQYGWSYTAKQTEFTQKMATWLHQTYTPRGMLGEMKLSVLAPEPSFPINSKSYSSNEAEKNNRNALPNTYGAFGKMYMLLMKTADKKFWPINGMANFNTWFVMANNLELITNQIVNLSSTDEYYCIMPRYSIGMKGRFDKEWNTTSANYRNFTNSPKLKNYDHYMIPAKIIDPGSEKYVVVLTKDRKPLPLEHITMQQFIQRLETQLPLMYKIAINNGTKVDNLEANAKRGLQVLKDKYKDQLNEWVYLTDINNHLDLLDLAQIEPNKNINWLSTKASTPDRAGYVSEHFPLLRLKKGVKEACAKGDPQWIVCRVEKGGDAGNEGDIHMMESFIERFNYDYLYNYFFGPDKVIQPYKPVPFDDKMAAAPVKVSPSAEATKKSAEASILFFEDFSTVQVGEAPASWTTQRSEISGEKVSVTTLTGAEGKWLKLKRKATPKGISLPVGGDFELSYDVLVHKGDVPWGTPGIDLKLELAAAERQNFSVNVTPGDMNRATAAGWVTINVGAAGCKMESYYSIPEFTGSKPINRVKMSIRKKGESVTVLCNNNKVFDCSTAFKAGMSLKGLQFDVNEKNVYYLTNVLLKKL